MNLTGVSSLSDSKALLKLYSNEKDLITIVKYELLIDVMGHITPYEQNTLNDKLQFNSNLIFGPEIDENQSYEMIYKFLTDSSSESNISLFSLVGCYNRLIDYYKIRT